MLTTPNPIEQRIELKWLFESAERPEGRPSPIRVADERRWRQAALGLPITGSPSDSSIYSLASLTLL